MLHISSQGWVPPEGAAQEPLCVLLIDDEPDLVSGLRELLESEGYEVATAIDGADALGQLRRGLRPSAIVLDLMMPGMDGWDFRQEQLKDDELREIPTIILTAVGFSESSVKTQFGDIEFVRKPSGHAILLGALTRACAGLEPH